jgi:hypothetical protein
MVTEGAIKDSNGIEGVMEKDGRVFLQIKEFAHITLCYEITAVKHYAMLFRRQGKTRYFRRPKG